MSPQAKPKQTKAERLAQAREESKRIREEEAKRQKRNSFLVRGGVVLSALAIVLVITLIVIQGDNSKVADTGAVPKNVNNYGGLTIGRDGEVVEPAETVSSDFDLSKVPVPTAPASQQISDPSKVAVKPAEPGKPIPVVIYLDFMCPYCKKFEEATTDLLKKYADEGKVTVEHRGLNFLDRASQGTAYSSRAASAALCVADSAPKSFGKFHNDLYEQQPKENSPGLDNDKIKQIARDSGAQVDECIDKGTYRPFVAYTSRQSQVGGVSGTPTVFVDGVHVNPKGAGTGEGDYQYDTAAFQQLLDEAIAAKASAR